MGGYKVLINDETWLDENMKWQETNAESKELRIGGIPHFTVGKETFDWPHYDYKGILYPLSFIGQLLLPNNKLVYLFIEVIDTTQIALIIRDVSPYNGTTCGWVEGESVPEWITLKKINRTQMSNFLHSDIAITPGVIPDAPYWIQAIEVPKNHTYFLFQIDEHPGGLEINDNLVTYVYWNKKNEVVLFNQTY